ncbi:hypothetical protein WG936_05975 [Corynebacterium sp. H127]|uniref:hypothetical protein n=1 Tax=Corynebacterium sp. H127 TaxID=3133418 RepID=UPI0030A55D07
MDVSPSCSEKPGSSSVLEVGQDDLTLQEVETALAEDQRQLEELDERRSALLERIAVSKSALQDYATSQERVRDRVRSRAEGRYFAGISYRITDKQKALIAFAVDELNMSRQEMIEHVLMPWLEERVGEKFDELHPEWR